MPNPDSLEDIADTKLNKEREEKAADKAGTPDEKRLNVEVPERLHAAIKAQAGIQRRTMKGIVEEALHEWLDEHAQGASGRP
jgi:predicted HicB family RNase H-like nuclease